MIGAHPLSLVGARIAMLAALVALLAPSTANAAWTTRPTIQGEGVGATAQSSDGASSLEVSCQRSHGVTMALIRERHPALAKESETALMIEVEFSGFSERFRVPFRFANEVSELLISRRVGADFLRAWAGGRRLRISTQSGAHLADFELRGTSRALTTLGRVCGQHEFYGDSTHIGRGPSLGEPGQGGPLAGGHGIDDDLSEDAGFHSGFDERLAEAREHGDGEPFVDGELPIAATTDVDEHRTEPSPTEPDRIVIGKGAPAQTIIDTLRKHVASNACDGVGMFEGDRAVSVGDLTGNGQLDAVVNYEWFVCDGRTRERCGVQVCAYDVYFYDGEALTKAHSAVGMGTAINGKPAAIHSIAHGGQRFEIRWDGKAFVHRPLD